MARVENTEPSEPSARRRGGRRGERRRSPRIAEQRRSFGSTLRALQELSDTGAKVSVHVCDLDRDLVVFAGDDFLPYPVADLGAIPVLVEVAAQLADGALDAATQVSRTAVVPPVDGGLWSHLETDRLPLGDLAVLASAVSDPVATNALIERVGLVAVTRRLVALGMPRTAVLDAYRDERGPDDAPYTAIGTTREFAELMTQIVNGQAVSPAVSAQVGEWLNLNTDLSMVAAATGLDPFRHEDDKHGLLFINKTGRDDGVRAEAGVLAGPRAGVAYAITVCFDDLTISHRVRVSEALRTFGLDLMEYVH